MWSKRESGRSALPLVRDDRIRGRDLDLGIFRRRTPFSPDYGISRGGAIDRFYIDRFVRETVAPLGGSILEFGWPDYRIMFDPSKIQSYDVLDINARNSSATITADVQKLSRKVSKRFDVIVCTQVLQYVQDPAAALEELRRALKPGGTLVLTVPFIARQDAKMREYWHFSDIGVRRLLHRFRGVHVSVGGNLQATICFLAGLGQADLPDPRILRPTDPHHYIVVLARARKALAGPRASKDLTNARSPE